MRSSDRDGTLSFWCFVNYGPDLRNGHSHSQLEIAIYSASSIDTGGLRLTRSELEDRRDRLTADLDLEGSRSSVEAPRWMEALINSYLPLTPPGRVLPDKSIPARPGGCGHVFGTGGA